jgi:homoserine O-succinyltransferase
MVKTRDVRIQLDLQDEVRSPGMADRGTAAALRIALVNNMPDAALGDTESQFVGLLQAASGEFAVELTFYALTKVSRGDRALQHLNNNYRDVRDLLNDHFDGVIITGTEPQHSDLREEPYWNELSGLLNWAEQCTSSTVLSCLSAHAGVLHANGVLRRRLDDKLFGVFTESTVAQSPLTHGLDSAVCFPHSRWNDLRPAELEEHGYTILTRSDETGAGLFVQKRKNSLFVHFQGHPEYQDRTLLKEYRRDIRRFLRMERETYPSMPRGYFDAKAARLLSDLQAEALEKRNEETLQMFPEASVSESLQKRWHGSSVRIYQNWLQYLAARKTQPQDARAALYAARG